MNKRTQIVGLVILVLVGAGWVLVNPASGFGISQYGLTTYKRMPVPFVDLQIRPDGAVRWVSKTHDLDLEALDWVLASEPEALVVALGWRDSVRLAKEASRVKGLKVYALPTEEALAHYNALLAQGLRVAIHVHSTC